MEVWKDIEGYEGLYQVSNYGRVKALSKLKISKNKNGVFSFYTKEIIIKKSIDSGYEKVVLTHNKKRSTQKVHRLVAKTFLGNKDNLVVNHIDFNRSNNKLENLEWCTVKENVKHSRENNRYPKRKMSESHKAILKKCNSKKVICTKTNKLYNSISEASIELNIKRSTLIHYLLGTRKNITTLIYKND